MADGWGSAGEIDHQSLYKMSFGDLPDESIYEDGMNHVQTFAKGEDIVTQTGEGELAKAVNVGAASGAAGYAYTPIVWDQAVVDVTRKMTPLVGLIPKVTNAGKVAQYYRVTARGAATWGDEDPALNEADDTKEEASESIRYLRVTGRVTGVAQIAGAHFESSMQREVLNKTQSMNEAIEEAILIGNNSTDQYQHDGLQQQLTANSSAHGAAITLSAVRELVSDCFVDKGSPNLIITDPYTADDLVEQIMDYTRFVDPNVTIAWGLQLPSIQTVVGRIPILASQFMETDSGSRRLFCVNTNFIQQRILKDITFERLAKTGDSEKFFLSTYRTTINKFPEGMGQLSTISD
jgi:hypothetical protein